jgi:hypothetical protein
VLFRSDGDIYLAHGHAGQVARLAPDGRVVGVTGAQGKAAGRFGEAHAIALSMRGEIFVADIPAFSLDSPHAKRSLH